MHPQSERLMQSFASTVPAGATVVDVGSRDVNGNFREMFASQRYIGIDIQPGANVDVVVSEYQYPFASNSIPFVVSGSTLEHVRKTWLWMREVARILKPGGRLCVIVPYEHPYHEHPIDCWRVYPEGLKALFDDAGLTPLEVRMCDGTDGGWHPVLQERLVYHNTDGMCDTLGIATK